MDAKHLLAKKGSLFGQSKNVCPKKQSFPSAKRCVLAARRKWGWNLSSAPPRESDDARIVAGAAHRDSDGLKLHVAAGTVAAASQLIRGQTPHAGRRMVYTA